MVLFKLDSFGGVYADAFVGTESNELLFVSLFGSQTEILRLQAAITIGDDPEAGGLCTLKGQGEQGGFLLRTPNSNQLGKHSGVISKTLFGDLVQIWIYNKTLLQNLDYSNGIGYFLIENAQDVNVQIWNMIKSMSEVPLLDEWQDCVLTYGKRFYRRLNDPKYDFKCLGIKIDLSDGFTDFIESLLKSGELPV